jgi:putative ABC transport system permease protein
VFQQQALADAPQTIFTALRMPHDRLESLQNRIVKRFPNIRVIDMSEAISALAGVTRRIAAVVNAFALLSIAAGLLIIVSSVYATRIARTREAVYYKVLGARRQFVIKTFTLENLILGLSSALLAQLAAQIGSWLLCRQVFDIAYRPFWWESLIAVGLAGLIIVTVGLAPSWSILKHKPVVFLRQQTEE